jgi:hypothetical protein
MHSITIKKNFNNKLACDLFIHIQPPWCPGIPADEMIIKTADNSHDPVTVKVIDSARQKFGELSAAFIYLSHAMDPAEFNEMIKKADPKITPDTELAIYFYKKIA